MTASEIEAITGTAVIKVTEHWIVGVTSMIFNDRIILMRRARDEWSTGYVAGFCYHPKGLAAATAALVWDPETQEYPVGFQKVAFDARTEEEIPNKEEK